MQFLNSNLIVYNNNNSYFLNVIDLIDKFKINKKKTKNDCEIYTFNDDIYIDSLKNGKLELNKINEIAIKKSNNDIPILNLNDDINYLSNVICYNIKNKKFFQSSTLSLENNFVVQNNMNFAFPHISFIDDMHLNLNLGYLVGYWLLRGGFYKVDNKEHTSWSGRDSDILKLKSVLKDQTILTKNFKEKLQLLLIIEESYFDFFKTHFFENKTKVLPNWLLIAKQEFIQGLFYGLIASNSYISNDSKGNFYLAIKITNSNIIELLHVLFRFRFNIYSRIIGEHNHLSFKFNKKLFDFISNGENKKLIEIEQLSKIKPVLNKEIIINSFKLIPWYKFKNPYKIEPIQFIANIKLEQNLPFMISNGLFTNS